MSALATRVATLHVFGAAPTRATALLESLSPGRRLVRALAVLAACWGAAIVSIFFPVAHFFLVPGFLVPGVVWAVLRGRERQQVLRLQGVCPRCAREQEFVQGGRQNGQAWVSCPGCFNRVFVTIEPPDSAKLSPRRDR
jgi:hypothetical protein